MHGYIDLWTGLAGDMMVGALLDAGWPEEEMRAVLAQIPMGGVEVVVEERLQRGIRGLGIRVDAVGQPSCRSFREIRTLLLDSTLATSVRTRSLSLFQRLAEVEGQIHGVEPDAVHFHELGACDSIVDIVLAVAGIEGLGITSLGCGSVPVSRGEVETVHGKLPVPAPATLRLLEGLPIHWLPIEGEWLTPTGALILSGLARPLDPPPSMRLQRAGIGAGMRTSTDRANIVRLLVGDEAGAGDESVGWISVIETNIDDLDPRHEAVVAERLLTGGALDVSRAPVLMKKGRWGTRWTVLCRPDREEEIGSLLLRQTTTLGIRVRREFRRELDRWTEVVTTPYGPVRIKWSRPSGLPRPVPEFDDLEARSREKGVPTWLIEQAAMRAVEAVGHAEPPNRATGGDE